MPLTMYAREARFDAVPPGSEDTRGRHVVERERLADLLVAVDAGKTPVRGAWGFAVIGRRTWLPPFSADEGRTRARSRVGGTTGLGTERLAYPICCLDRCAMSLQIPAAEGPE